MSAIARLGRFAAREAPQERCGLCAAALEERHPHVAELASGKLLCSCPGCACLFPAGSARFRRVPDRVAALGDLRLKEEEWAAFGIPVGLAFFRKRSALPEVVAAYPSPLGAIESAVPPEAWEALLRANPSLSMEDDVEALLIRGREAFVVPLDACFALVGLLRRTWKGFTGGDEAARAVDAFFEDLRTRAGRSA